MKYVMALDQGTTSSRCIIFDRLGQTVSCCEKEYEQIYIKSGWIEHNPIDIWLSQYSVAKQALEKAGLTYADIIAMGITNQRETTVCWDKRTGTPVYNAIVWQCRRTADRISELKNTGYSDMIREKTGLLPDAYFSASKIEWILKNVPKAAKLAQEGNLLFGTVDTWLMWKLSGGKIHATDYTNASRTMLFNIHTLDWDEELLKLFGIPKSCLPTVHPSGFRYGETEPGLFGGPIPISGVTGDQQSALFGQGCFNEGEAKNTYGTGCFLLMNTGHRIINSKNGLLTTIAATREGEEVTYALEGSVFVGGAVVQWLRDEMRIIETAPQSEDYAKASKDTDGVYLVPSFTGMGAPYWNGYARGMVVGLSRGCSRENFIRAALEAIDYQVLDVLKAMENDSEIKIFSLKVDGGASNNDFLMQFQSDILGCSVVRPKTVESTALGAAYLAGLTEGYWKDKEEILANWSVDRKFTPQMEPEKTEKLIKGWHRAVRCALAWAEDNA